MADTYIGLALGQIDGMSDQLTVGTSSAGSAVDVEVRIRNTPSVGGIQVIEVNKILELITWFLINHEVDFTSQAAPNNMPDL